MFHGDSSSVLTLLLRATLFHRLARRRTAKISLLIAPSFAVPRWQKRIPVPLSEKEHTYDVRSGKVEKGWKLRIYVDDNKGGVIMIM